MAKKSKSKTKYPKSLYVVIDMDDDLPAYMAFDNIFDAVQWGQDNIEGSAEFAVYEFESVASRKFSLVSA